MKYNEEEIERLKEAVERVVGRKILHPKEFDFLSRQIEGYVGEHISVSTLKRMWGYVNANSELSQSTLDILTKLIGYESWESFTQDNDNGEENSHKLICRKLFTSALTPGDKISVVWRPDRKIVIRFEGQDLFIVLESINSKLASGDLFHCVQFVENQPLLLSGLYRQGMPPCDYICGRQGGIIWNINEQAMAQ